MVFFLASFHGQHMAGHIVSTWWPLLEGKRQFLATELSLPPLSHPRPHSQLVYPSLPGQGHYLPKYNPPPLQQDCPSNSALLRAGCTTCLETREPAGLATPSLELIRLLLFTPLPRAGHTGASCLSGPHLELGTSLSGPPGPSLQATHPEETLKKCTNV